MSTAASAQPDPRAQLHQRADRLTPEDLVRFARLGITEQLLLQAQVQRVSDCEAREKLVVASNRAGDMQGIMFPYISPVTGYPVSYRIRRDYPELENRKPKDKYLSAYGCKRTFYYPPNAADLLNDLSVPLVFVEAEKSVLALTAWAQRTGRKILVLGLGGCWGWRGRIGKAETPSGAPT